MFWIFAAVMLVVALVIVLFPLWRPAGQFALDSNTANVELLKEQLRELEDERAAGSLIQGQYSAARADLEAAVAADLVDDESRLRSLSKKNRQLLSLILLVVVSLGSIGLYQEVTTYREVLTQRLATQAVGQSANRDPPPIGRMIEVLAAGLRENPDNAEGWQMLGRAYLAMEKTDQAVAAYARAYELVGDRDPTLLADYAEAIAFASDNSMQGRPLELIDQALTIAPGMPKALWLKGFANFQRGDYMIAIRSWNEAVLAPGLADEARQTLQTYISEARQKMSLADEGQDVASDAWIKDESVAGSAIKVEVSLSDSISSQVDAREAVFVFARAASGSPIPLAVRKLTVADLPVTVTLDDSMAMLVGMSLSSQQQVVIGARISRSGSPIPQVGDFQGLSGVVEPSRDVRVPVVISEALE